jgi:excisionase family DNA binding protein
MEFLTIEEVAKKLRVNRTTVLRWIKNGALEAIALPHANTRTVYRVKKATLDKVLASTTAA